MLKHLGKLTSFRIRSKSSHADGRQLLDQLNFPRHGPHRPRMLGSRLLSPAHGIVGPSRGSKAREVLIPDDMALQAFFDAKGIQ